VVSRCWSLLSASLLLCHVKAKVKVKKLDTIVKADAENNAEGYFRVAASDVQIHLEVNEENKLRPWCLSIFKNYCTVTQSVRKGIEVKVNLVF
jgi:uncharacterized OsmC-like protein